MPELPEVETVVRYLRPQLVQRKIFQVRHASPLMVTDRQFASQIEGTSIVRIDRQGKWMFVRLDRPSTLVLHLGMSGVLQVVDEEQEIESHTHVRLALDDGRRELRFVDPRRFGEVLIAGPKDFSDRFGPRRLGPDALDISLDELSERVLCSNRNAKAVLMDQKVLAGIGNIYVDEILHAAGVSPRQRASTLRCEELSRMHAAIKSVLEQAIKANGTTIHSFVGSDGQSGGFQNTLAVYGRAGKPCRSCGTPIKCSGEIIIGRSTYWCPSCQPSKKRRKLAARKARNVVPHH